MPEDSQEQPVQGLSKAKPEKKAMVVVTRVSSQGQSTVVEWYDGDYPKRKIVPTRKLTAGKEPRTYEIEEKVLDKCPDYGVAWAKLLPDLPGLEELEKILKQRGIWTAEDFGTKNHQYLGALQQFHNKGAMAILKSREVKQHA